MGLKKWNKAGTLLVALTMLSVSLSACAGSNPEQAKASLEKESIKVGVTATYIPWCYQKEGVLQGYEIDVWNEIGKRAGWEVEFVPAKFSGLFGMLDAGQIVSIGQQISITKEREEKYDFSSPYAYSTYSLIVKKDSSYESKEGLKGKKVGVGLGGNGERTLRAMNEEYQLGLEIITYDGGSASTLNDVNMGRLDASWLGTVAANVGIEESGFPLRAFDPGYVKEINAYPFVKGKHEDKIGAVNEALAGMKADGTLQGLSEKWFHMDSTQEP